MDDIAGKIEELLNDPDGMAKIQSMAESVLGNGKAEEKGLPNSLPQTDGLGSDIDIATVMKVLNLLKSGQNSSGRANLLLALKPHLNPSRQQKVDSAIKIMKIIEILPILKQQGLLDKLL